MDALIIDYAMGNLRSVANALGSVGCAAVVSADPADARKARRIVLPGVGAFGDGMRNLEERGWIDVLEEEVRGRGKPFLGLCLGMQLLAERGTEHEDLPGLGWLRGTVERLPAEGVRIPHMGWNDVTLKAGTRLGAGLGGQATFYFVHSFAFVPEDGVVAGTCHYGTTFAAIVESENVFGTQFHPEKSQASGLAVLRNFLATC